jgi:hypothetical protein
MMTDETFFAWLDGELDPVDAERAAAEVAANPQLAERAARHRAMKARLTGAFDTLLEAPVPEPLLAAAAQAEDFNVVDIAAAHRSRETRTLVPLPKWAALAATLAVGIFAGTMVPRQRGSPVAIEGGKVYAAAALDDSLDTQLASAPRGDVRIGLTFRDRGGAICRSFTGAAASGLACRNGGRWQVRGLFAAPEGQSGSYRMAAGADPNLAALIDTTMTGEPFDPNQEKAAQAHGWR